MKTSGIILLIVLGILGLAMPPLFVVYLFLIGVMMYDRAKRNRVPRLFI